MNGYAVIPSPWSCRPVDSEDDLVSGEIFYQDQPTPPLPVPTAEEVLASALAERDRLLTIAALRIAPLQDAVDLDDVTTEETFRLKKWKQYRVAVNRVPDQLGFPGAINWPDEPT
ncbi:tail fiber assembly protein [Pseudomonas fluorescens group sp.]|nr:tail fiber assembly protein [Pseudomonas fluorescens group sp.]MBZ6456684.1 tail fiber assembly protein [Pseudomonas fluorescens group sp.]MBZ6462631.1 tail fiber assembly protein [Pseudomonas fluorescens group sp.]MBZ6468772.1 tail fiber assembly protein [Pseudomonas fluorescens group sp.]